MSRKSLESIKSAIFDETEDFLEDCLKTSTMEPNTCNGSSLRTSKDFSASREKCIFKITIIPLLLHSSLLSFYSVLAGKPQSTSFLLVLFTSCSVGVGVYHVGKAKTPHLFVFGGRKQKHPEVISCSELLLNCN